MQVGIAVTEWSEETQNRKKFKASDKSMVLFNSRGLYYDKKHVWVITSRYQVKADIYQSQKKKSLFEVQSKRM
jgi:hypothetical protein